ncbi:MAG TPA: hypothetical protein VJV22_17725 [Acidobacteriaceae bacterium]|nr:hypothetical protein [Acidobacteriaceae bacterium]
MAKRRDAIAWLTQTPAETLLPARAVIALLEDVEDTEQGDAQAGPGAPWPVSWREKLWTVPAETRLGIMELTEALGQPSSWVYRRTSLKTGLVQLPHRKLDGELVFVTSEIRDWLETQEEVVVARSPRNVVPIDGSHYTVWSGSESHFN